MPSMNPSFSISTAEVRYIETDQMGVTHHGTFPVWFEIGRTGYMAQRGLPYGEIEARGVLLPVAELWYRMMAPARYGDTVEIVTWLSRLESRRVRFAYHVRRQGTPLCRGWSTLMCVGTDFRPRRFPDWVREVMGPEMGDDLPDAPK